MNRAALADQLDQSFIHRAGCVRQFLIGPTPPAATHLQAETIVQHFAHFGIRHTQTMLEVCRQGFGAQPHNYASCRSRGSEI